MNPKLQTLAPMLAVKDVANAVDYFRDRLGFDVSLVFNSELLPGYAVVQRDGFEVHFLEDPSRDVAQIRSGLHATVNHVDSLYESFKDSGAFADGFPRHLDAIREHPPEDKDYGMRDMIFVDPHGYILVFGQPLQSGI